MSVSFNGVTGFNLKWPCRHTSRPALANKGEWIELRKEKNKLPTARLRTWVLYPRYNGDISDNGIDLNNPDETDLGSWKDSGWNADSFPQPNFRFYHNKNSTGKPAGRQIGSIWGFPLLNVGPNGEKNVADPIYRHDTTGIHTLWPAFGSCITNQTKTTAGILDISGNETMLVNISNERNIIVLDFAGYDEGNSKKKYEKISYNLDKTSQQFYIVLRVKSGHERLVPDTDNATANGKHFHSNLVKVDGSAYAYAGTGSFLQKQFYSLVEYTYECDIIGPKPMLDLTLDYFSFIGGNTGNGRLFGNGGSSIWSTETTSKKLAIPRKPPYDNNNNNENANAYTTDISINIIMITI